MKKYMVSIITLCIVCPMQGMLKQSARMLQTKKVLNLIQQRNPFHIGIKLLHEGHKNRGELLKKSFTALRDEMDKSAGVKGLVLQTIFSTHAAKLQLLHYAILEKHDSLLEILWPVIWDINEKDEISKATLLHMAVWRNRLDLIQRLLEHKDLDINIFGGWDNLTALHCAVWFDRADIVKVLLGDPRINSSVKGGKYNCTAKGQAILDRNEEIIKIFDEFGVKV